MRTLLVLLPAIAVHIAHAGDTVAIDCSRTVPMERFWSASGWADSDQNVDAGAGRAQAAWMGAVPFDGCQFIRPHNLLNQIDIRDGAYDWKRFDAVIDQLRRHGLKLVFEIMGQPKGALLPARDGLGAWAAFVRDVARHLMERYGADEVRSWWFESTNEPMRLDDKFVAYYRASAEGLRAADAQLRFGGVGRVEAGLIDKPPVFLTYAAGADGVLDHATWHVKNEITPMVDKELKLWREYADQHPHLKDRPVLNTEGDPWWDYPRTKPREDKPGSYRWIDGNAERGLATSWYAAWFADGIWQHQVRMAEEAGVRYALWHNDHGFLVRDFGARGFVGWVCAPTDQTAKLPYAVKKPITNATAFAGLLGPRRAHTTTPWPVTAGRGVIATVADDAVVLLAFNRTAPMTFELRIAGLPAGPLTMATWRLDAEHGNIDAARAALDPALTLEQQYDALAAVQEAPLTGAPAPLPITDGTAVLPLTLPKDGVALIVIAPQPATPPPAPGAPVIEAFKQGALVCWPGVPRRTIRTYEVIAADGKRLNVPDTLFGAWFLRGGDGAGVTVRAVDFWGRVSPVSPVSSLPVKR